ncbi:hypothetical protein [Rhizobium sp. No.120]
MLDLDVFVHPATEIAAHQSPQRILIKPERAGVLQGDRVALFREGGADIAKDINLIPQLAVGFG